MVQFFKLLGVILLVVIIVIILVVAIALGLYYLMQYVPCELIAYTETGILFLLVALLVIAYNNNESKE